MNDGFKVTLKGVGRGRQARAKKATEKVSRQFYGFMLKNPFWSDFIIENTGVAKPLFSYEKALKNTENSRFLQWEKEYTEKRFYYEN